MSFDRQIHKLTDKQETDTEVFYRLEQERDKKITDYRDSIKSFGFDELDADFDDLSGVF